MSRKIRLLVWHHTVTPRSATLEQIRAMHMDPNKVGGPFDDIGYHGVIEEDGKLRQGRPLEQIGSHCKGRNHDSVGYAVTGDNTRPDRHWNAAQVFTVREVTRAWRLLVPGIEVCGHCEAPGGKTPTVCPGLDVQGLLSA